MENLYNTDKLAKWLKNKDVEYEINQINGDF